MDSSQAIFREDQRRAIDAEIKSLKESIRALGHRRNTLAPILSLPPEIIATIFSFLRIPVASSHAPLSTLGEKPDRLAWLRLSHVCRHWREFALNQPLFWSHLNFTIFSWAGAAEILARAKTVPLYLEARVPIGRWDNARFSAFQKELQARADHICHLGIGAEFSHLSKTLEGLVSPAPTLECLSLSGEGYRYRATSPRVSVPDTLFDGTTPRLSCLELINCDISWKSPLLKGLKDLCIRNPSVGAIPSLSAWLDALGEMAQLKTLTLHSASPNVPRGASLPFHVERTVTLPSLTSLDVSASARGCGLALAHLVLPALTRLCLMARSYRKDGGDVLEVLPHFSRHAHRLQHTQPLQSVVDRSNTTCVDLLAWTMPDIDEVDRPGRLSDAVLSAPVAFSFENEDWTLGDNTEVFNAAMAALPLDSLVTLSSSYPLSPFDEQSWLLHAPRWHLIQRLRLGPTVAHGFREMLLGENGGRESPLLPSLTKLVLVESALSARRTFRLCEALMKRVEQGVPLETLDLRTCVATSRAVELLSEIVVDVPGPDETRKELARRISTWDTAARGLFVEDDNSGLEDFDEDDLGHDEWDNFENDGDWLEFNEG